MSQCYPSVDAYLRKAPAFAQPIIEHLREVPLWFAHPIGASNSGTFKPCWFGVTLLAVAIPWPPVIDSYFRSTRDALEARSGSHRKVSSAAMSEMATAARRERLTFSFDATAGRYAFDAMT